MIWLRPIIGVVGRFEKISEINNAMVIYENIIKAINKSGGDVIGLVNSSNNVLKLCDGVLLQGGNDVSLIDLPIIKYCYTNDIPILGICLGMQMLSLFFSGHLDNFNNNYHMDKSHSFTHFVILNQSSKLYDIVRHRYILVNSRHKSYVKSSKLMISGISKDGYIESVEDITKRFFIGVQWHPETTFEYDIVSQRIFRAFIDECRKGRK